MSKVAKKRISKSTAVQATTAATVAKQHTAIADH